MTCGCGLAATSGLYVLMCYSTAEQFEVGSCRAEGPLLGFWMQIGASWSCAAPEAAKVLGVTHFKRLIYAQDHLFAALFEAHVSPVAAQFCAKHCVSAIRDAFQETEQPEAALRNALQLLDTRFAIAAGVPLQVLLGCLAGHGLLRRAQTPCVLGVGTHAQPCTHTERRIQSGSGRLHVPKP